MTKEEKDSDNISLPEKKEKKEPKVENKKEEKNKVQKEETKEEKVEKVEKTTEEKVEEKEEKVEKVETKEEKVEPKEEVKEEVKEPIETPEIGIAPTPTTPSGKTSSLKDKIMKFGILPVIGVVAVVVILIALVLTTAVTSSPKSVFKNNINNIYKEVSRALDDAEDFKKDFDYEEKALYISGNVSIDSNVEGLEDIKDLTIGMDAGIDLKDEQFLAGVNAKGTSEEVSIKALLDGDKAYLTTSFMDEIIETTAEELDLDDVDIESIKDSLDEISENANFNYDDYDYILKTFKNALIKSLDSKQMTKKSAKYEVDGNQVSATKITYTFDDDALEELITSICEQLLEDDDFLSKLADISGAEKGDIKEYIKEIKDAAKDIDMDDELAINIYVKGLFNNACGFSIELDEKEYFSIYSNNKGIVEMTFDNHQKDDYDSIKIVATATTEKDTTSIVVKYNKNKLLTAEINELTDEVIDFSFKVYDSSEDEQPLLGASIYFSAKEDKDSISGEYKFKLTDNSSESEEYMQLSGSYSIQVQDDLDFPDTSNAVSEDDVDSEELIENLRDIVDKDKALDALLGDTVDELEKSSLNSYNMKEITTEAELEKVLTKTSPTVLYVGTYSYSNDSYYLWYNLKSAQYNLDFYSYTLNTYSASQTTLDKLNSTVCTTSNSTSEETKTDENTTTETENTETENTENTETKTETTTTTTDTCKTYPAIYLIKDGKVYKTITSISTYYELTDALKEIGIE